MSQCYNFVLKEYNSGIFDEFIDATYILTMEKSLERHKNIENQLKKVIPTKKIFIVYNKGFKNCDKGKNIDVSTKDIIHSNLEVYKHANKNKYNNILTLEDDFIFQEIIKEKKHIKRLNKFLKAHDNKSLLLYLGGVKYILFPYTNYFNINYISCGAESIISTRKYRDYILKNKKKIYKKGDWDIYNNIKLNKYSYYKTLITQTFPNTENRNNWWNPMGINYVIFTIIKLLKLDKQSQPGYNILNNTIPLIFYFLLIIIFINFI
jgi:predicted nucleic acid-binding protein